MSCERLAVVVSDQRSPGAAHSVPLPTNAENCTRGGHETTPNARPPSRHRDGTTPVARTASWSTRSGPSHPRAAARRAWIGEGQGPRRERAQRAQAKPSTRARPEQAGGGQLALSHGCVRDSFVDRVSETAAFIRHTPARAFVR